jgi:ribokinase
MLTPEELRSFPWDDLSWLIVNEGELMDLLEAFKSAPGSGSESRSRSGPSTGAGAGNGSEKPLEERAEGLMQALHTSDGFSKEVSIICTFGAEGITYFQPPSASSSSGGNGPPAGVKTGHLPAAKLERPLKDTTGAGDCFAGYFAAGLMRGEELEEVLKNCLTVS